MIEKLDKSPKMSASFFEAVDSKLKEELKSEESDSSDENEEERK